MERPSFARIVGSSLAGAAGFGLGLCAGLFLILNIWGIEVDVMAFAVVTGGLASIFAGTAIALTVSSSRRLMSVLIALALGLVLVGLVVALEANVGFLALGGLVLVVVTAILIRSGAVDAVVAE